MKSEIETLKDGVKPFNQNSLASLHQETTKLQRIIEDLKLINHLDFGKLELFLRPLELNKLVEEVLKHAQNRLEASPVKVGWTHTLSDATSLQQILLNFKKNTAHHAPESFLKIRSGRDQDEVVMLLIDKGSGVSEEDLPYLRDELL